MIVYGEDWLKFYWKKIQSGNEFYSRNTYLYTKTNLRASLKCAIRNGWVEFIWFQILVDCKGVPWRIESTGLSPRHRIAIGAFEDPFLKIRFDW